MISRTWIGRGVLLAALIVAAIVPFLDRSIGSLLPGPVNGFGSMNLLALMLLSAATAVTLDLMFGYTGLLSMGHALYFAIGCYSVVMYTNMESVGFGMAVLLSFLTIVACALAGNATSLKLTGFGFAMATLALAQLMAIFVERGYAGSGGEVGLLYEFGTLPEAFSGLVNSRNVYWLCLATLVVVYAIARYAVGTQAGMIWQAIRENPLRAQVLGVNVYAYRLLAAVVASVLAGLCGITYSILMGGANPSIIAMEYSLGLILMVVLGGRGVLWGAMIGGLVYTYLTMRLSALSTTPGVADLPDVLRIPLAQPDIIVGVVFVLAILFLPRGLASLFTGALGRRRRAVGEPAVSAPTAAAVSD